MSSVNEQVTLLIGEAEAKLATARALLDGLPAADPEPELGARVLAEIINRGGSVGRGELYAIAAEIGMDKRGLGGLFRKTGKTLLHELPGDRVVLTPDGAERGQRYLNLRQRSTSALYGASEPQLARVAETSFAEDWDSAEDSAYDEL
ncbi:MAG: hypothetical protein ABI559_11245 [Chloroflexota bacterium]